SAQDPISIIPEPKEISFQPGVYIVNPTVKVAAYQEFVEVADLLKEHPYISFNEVETIKKKKHIPSSGIRLIKAEADDKLAQDAYRMVVAQDGIAITANKPEAVINAI